MTSGNVFDVHNLVDSKLLAILVAFDDVPDVADVSGDHDHVLFAQSFKTSRLMNL